MSKMNTKKETKTNTANIMLSGFHIDRGINCTSELEEILKNLKNFPEEFNAEVANKLIRTIQLTRNCFYDCYDQSYYKSFLYEQNHNDKEGHTA